MGECILIKRHLQIRRVSAFRMMGVIVVMRIVAMQVAMRMEVAVDIFLSVVDLATLASIVLP